MPLPEVLKAFNNYVEKDIPPRLIDLHTMDLVDTDGVKRAFITTVEAVTEADIERHTSHANQRREDVIKAIITSIVKYAVLSHVWDADGSCLRKHYWSDPQPSGPAWDELMKFCDLARGSFKCRFGWTHVVCINPHRSEERTNAIQSSFHWFRNSYVCIAYLADASSRLDMSQDRWFRTVWTLSELLAPRRMKFYGAGWKALNNDYVDNDKADTNFLTLVSDGTGIPVDDLRSYWPGTDRVRKKLSWASRRWASMTEDRAYSLMAIFDVHIPVNYGEGEGKGKGKTKERSPEGYKEERLNRNLNPDAHHYRLCGDRVLPASSDLEFLRLRVVIIEVTRPVDVRTYTPTALSHNASISKVTVLKPQNSPTDYQPVVRMAVGVVDYGWTNRPNEGILLRGVEYFCFLLYKRSGFVGWQKVPTEKQNGSVVLQEWGRACEPSDAGHPLRPSRDLRLPFRYPSGAVTLHMQWPDTWPFFSAYLFINREGITIVDPAAVSDKQGIAALACMRMTYAAE
ncbi:hypothetical protein BU15DRAFT_73398 [Melanogaster broomeanus]|nr:hypothetical protein BU15DRAFT_73398 [Melanogaster broomeanus]